MTKDLGEEMLQSQECIMMAIVPTFPRGKNTENFPVKALD